jgi:hypothetical protein
MCPEARLEKCGKFEKYIDRLLKMGDWVLASKFNVNSKSLKEFDEAL